MSPCCPRQTAKDTIKGNKNDDGGYVFSTSSTIWSGQWWQESLLYWVKRPQESYVATLPFAIEMSLVKLGETLDRASRRARGFQDPSTKVS